LYRSKAATNASTTAPTIVSVLNCNPALRIVGVDPERGFLGGESQVLGLTLALIRNGHQADLLCEPAGELWNRANAAAVRCFPLRVRNAIDLAAGLCLRRFLSANRYDIVHFHTSRAHSLAPWVPRCAPSRVVTRRMDYPPNRLFAPWLFNRAVDGVAAISSSVAEAMASSGVDRSRIRIIPSGVDIDRFRPPSESEREKARSAWQIEPESIAIGTLGQLTERKGHGYLIDAVAALRRSRSLKMRFIIAGEGPLAASLRAKVAALGLDSVVKFAGAVKEPLALLWALDIFALPSLKEGLGVALLEAMASGLASVGSRAGGIVDAIEDGTSGLLAEPASVPELAQQLARLIDLPELRLRLGSQARTRICARFSLTAMAQDTIELYRACLNRSLRSGH
jgi:glycosyltransferase involved in cell wall biosynthesis